MFFLDIQTHTGSTPTFYKDGVFFGLGLRPSRSDRRLIRQNYTLTAAGDGWNGHRVTQAISWELWRWTGCGGKVLGAVCWSHPAAALSQAESSAFLFSIKLPRDKLSLEETPPPQPPPLHFAAQPVSQRTGREENRTPLLPTPILFPSINIAKDTPALAFLLMFYPICNHLTVKHALYQIVGVRLGHLSILTVGFSHLAVGYRLVICPH